MRNQTWPRTIAPMLLCASLAAGGCGEDIKTITVDGKVLAIGEQSYGTSGPKWNTPNLYCNPLFKDGQIEVFITDIPFCSQVKKNTSVATVFHSTDNTSLRLIFPTFMQKNPNGSFKQNDFKVARTNFCVAGTGGVAEAIFSHNTANQVMYDTYLEAKAGTISVTDWNGEHATQMSGTNIKGLYDLTFTNDEHITGSFDATFCSGITDQYAVK